MTAAPIDLLALRHYQGGPPHDQLRWLRREAPVYWHPEPHGPGFWALTRYDDVVTVSRDPATFSSAVGGTMIPDADPMLLAGMQLMMLNMDPPQHTKLRALVNKGFTPRMAAQLGPRIQQLAGQIIDRVCERGACDFVTDVAGELPSYVIAELVGIPRGDGRRLYQLTERMHTATTPAGIADAQAAVGEMMAYASALRDQKRTTPGHDLASVLVTAEVDGERLSDLEFNLFFMLLVNAGGDTTRNLVAGGLHTLLQHPDQLAALRRAPDMIPTAVEEMLRFQSPVMHFRRTATRATTLRGQAIEAGQKVVMFYCAANRDEAMFADPDRFDVTRHPNEHLAFGGGGTHYCLGANLARLEIHALFAAVLDRLPDLQLAGPVEWLPSVFINGPRRMPVRYTPSPARA
jgi:cytochrome P450